MFRYSIQTGGSPSWAVRIVRGNSHSIDLVNRGGAEDRAQHLRHGHNSRREIQADHFRGRPPFCRGGVIPVSDEDPRMMSGAPQHFVDPGMDKLMFEHGL